jgi:hypothetical protein
MDRHQILYKLAGNGILTKIQGIPENSRHHKTVTKIFSEPNPIFYFLLQQQKKNSDFPISQKT